MKTLLTALLLASITCCLKAQSNTPYPVRPRVNVDLDFSVPGGEYGSRFGVGFGGSGGLDIPVTKALYATGSAGVMSFYQGGKSEQVDTKSYVPMKAGAKFYFNPVFYGQIEIGTALGLQQGAGTAFIMTPGVGGAFPVSDRLSVNGGVRFESWTREAGNINQLTFKVGLQF